MKEKRKKKSRSALGRMSKNKGAAGEREVAQLLLEHGIKARRTAQYCGNTGDASDVTSDFKHIHIETKRTETLSLYTAMAQAKRDCGEKVPVVLHRRNGKDWLAIVDARILIELLKAFGLEKKVCIELPTEESAAGIEILGEREKAA